ETDAAAGEEHYAAPAYRNAQVDGLNLRYMEAGAGEEAVLLLHGFGGDGGNWMFVTEELASDYRTIALDLPGHGGSDKTLPGSGKLEDMAALVLAFIETEELGAVHLVGHSFGGAVAEQVAATGTTRSLTLLAPLLPGLALDRTYIADFVAAKRKRELRAVLTRLVADPDAISRDMVDDVLRYMRLDGVGAALERLGAVAREIAQAEPRPPAARAVAIWGEADRIIPPPGEGCLYNDHVLHVVADAGHLPHLERPTETTRLIRTALTG
ncbi:MAG: alpha/beta fold hydrolase, partial [Erythrobacter sp.]